MTNYEMLAHKLKNLKDAEDRCNRINHVTGKIDMALEWRMKAGALADQMLAMSIEEAERLVVV